MGREYWYYTQVEADGIGTSAYPNGSATMQLILTPIKHPHTLSASLL